MEVVSKALVCLCFALNLSQVQTLMLTDVQTPFLGTPLVPLKSESRDARTAAWLVAAHVVGARVCIEQAQE